MSTKPEKSTLPHAPAVEEVIDEIAAVWWREWGAFDTLGIARMLQRLKARNSTWVLSEKRLKAIRAAALADGRLARPSREVGHLAPLPPDVVRATDAAYVFDKAWGRAEPARAGALQPAFRITSGEMVWGHLRGLVAGMKATRHDGRVVPPADHNAGGTVVQAPWQYRVVAQPGEWKIAEVQRKPHPSAPTVMRTGWLLHHAAADPAALLALAQDVVFGAPHPRVAFVNRYDWCGHGPDPGDVARTLADAAPAVWRDAWTRRRSLWLRGMRVTKFHADWERWERVENFNWNAAFFCDARGVPGVVRLVAEPSELDERMEGKVSSSLYSEDEAEPFGVHMHLPPEKEYEIARFIYAEGKSEKFPEDDELIGIWYDYIYWEVDNSDLVAVPL